MTRREARQCGSLCTERYRSGKRFGRLCLKISKFLVRSEGRCGLHTPQKMRTAGRAI